LDILIKIIRPKGFFLPQVTMDAFELRNKNNHQFFSIRNIIDYFNIFTERYMISDEDKLKQVVYSCNSYPKTIEVSNVFDRSSGNNLATVINSICYQCLEVSQLYLLKI